MAAVVARTVRLIPARGSAGRALHLPSQGLSLVIAAPPSVALAPVASPGSALARVMISASCKPGPGGTTVTAASAAPAPKAATAAGRFLAEVNVVIDGGVDRMGIERHLGLGKDLALPGLHTDRATPGRAQRQTEPDREAGQSWDRHGSALQVRRSVSGEQQANLLLERAAVFEAKSLMLGLNVAVPVDQKAGRHALHAEPLGESAIRVEDDLKAR